MKRIVLLASLVAATLTAGETRADAPKRELPDYDGRGGEPKTAGDAALWVPRVLLAPPYFVSEYVIRRPIGAAIAGAERAGVPGLLYDFFTFGPDHKAGLVPVAFVEFGFRPSVGLYAFWDDAVATGNDIRFTAATWGTPWLAASLIDRVHLSSDPYDVAILELTGVRRPDYAYFGIGPSSRDENITRYGMSTLGAKVGIDERLWRMSSFHARTGVRTESFHRGSEGRDPSLDDVIANGQMAPPPGLDRGHTIAESTLSFALDTRDSKVAGGGSGVRLEANGLFASDVRQTSSWVRYGGSATAFVDVNHHERVLSLTVTTTFSDPLHNGTIPFIDLVQLGGFQPMRGFYPGRLIGRSAAVAELGYRWPIWVFLDGAMRAEIGNVFDGHLDGISTGLLRFSGSIGVETRGATDNPLQILFGVGSETFESGGKIDSFRFLIGTTHGF